MGDPAGGPEVSLIFLPEDWADIADEGRELSPTRPETALETFTACERENASGRNREP